jgi:hypothetical protein
MMRVLCFIGVLLLFAPGLAAGEPLSFEMKAHTQTARLGQQVLISVTGGNAGSRLSYAWTATKGQLKPVGSTAVFTPNEVGWAAITVRVSDGQRIVYEHALPLYAFKQFIILKADDLCQSSPGEVSPAWVSYFFYLATEKVKCSAGIITSCLPLWREESIRFLQSVLTTGVVEFFYHGWDHSTSEPVLDRDNETASLSQLAFERPTTELAWTALLFNPGLGKPSPLREYVYLLNVNPDPPLPPPYRLVRLYEFQGTSYAFQQAHLGAGIHWGEKKLGITIHTFGAPSDSTDANTIKVIDENPDIQVVFGKCGATKKLRLTQYIEMERGTGLVDYDRFRKQYDANRDKEYLFLQMHPQQAYFVKHFDSDFKKIIQYLKQEQVTFITPMDYLAYVQTGAAPINPLDASTPEELKKAPQPSIDRKPEPPRPAKKKSAPKK